MEVGKKKGFITFQDDYSDEEEEQVVTKRPINKVGKAIALDSDSEEVSSYHDSGDEDRKEEVEMIEEVVTEVVPEEPKGP